MRIVHVEDFFHPDAGYQLNVLARLQRDQGHEVDVVTAELDKVPKGLTAFFGDLNIYERDRQFTKRTGVAVHRLPLLGFYSGRAIFNPGRLLKAVKNLRPDVVLVHDQYSLTGIIFMLLSKFLSYPIVVDCHMLEMASTNRFRVAFSAAYRAFVSPVVLKRRIPMIRVQDSDFVEKHLGIPLDRTLYLSFGADTAHFRPDSEMRVRVRSHLGIDENAFVVIYAGKLDESKGGRFLAEALRDRLAPRDGRKIVFLIVGNAVGKYGETIECMLAASHNRLIRLPTQTYADTVRYYQASDLAVFPRQCSLSFFDMQSSGLPVLFEENEVNRQRAQSGTAFLFDGNSKEEFRRQIEVLASKDASEYDVIRRASRRLMLTEFDYVAIAQKITDILSSAAAERQCAERNNT